MRRKSHVRFSGEGVAGTPRPYPTQWIALAQSLIFMPLVVREEANQLAGDEFQPRLTPVFNGLQIGGTRCPAHSAVKFGWWILGWRRRHSAIQGWIGGVGFGKGTFVAVGSSGRIWPSDVVPGWVKRF